MMANVAGARRANEECRPPSVPRDLEPLELDGLEDHDGWAERAITGTAVAADAELVEIARSTVSGVRFTGAQLRRLELVDVAFAGCDFAGAVMEEVVAVRCSFTNCRFTEADLGGARLTDVRFTDCQLDEAALRLVRTERLEVAGGSARSIDLYEAWCTGSRWHDVDLTAADLSGARFGRARLHGSTLVDVGGARALEGAAIDPEQTVDVGLALLADCHITVDDDDR